MEAKDAAEFLERLRQFAGAVRAGHNFFGLRGLDPRTPVLHHAVGALRSIAQAAVTDDGLRQAAAVNPEDKFELVFRNLLERLFVERMDTNEEIFVRYMNDAPFRDIVSRWMASQVYKRLKPESAASPSDTGG